MATTSRFNLPDVGEGLTEAELVSWHVDVGDVVAVNDTLCEVETAKSLVELPSPVSGVIETLYVQEGTTVPVGATLVSFRVGEAASLPSVSAEPAIEELDLPASDRPLVLVGPGPTEPSERRRHLVPHAVGVSTTSSSSGRARATPVVRRLAREHGIDLEALANLTDDALVTEADVLAAATPPRATDQAHESRAPIKAAQRVAAHAMVTSAFTAPHVTEWLTVDATRSMKLLASLKQRSDVAGDLLTPLALVAQAFLLAIRRYPRLNVSWDEATQEVILHQYVDLGFAVATERGMVMLNLKNADTLGLVPLAAAMKELIATVRTEKTLPRDMTSGTITVTDFGSLGVDGATPILIPGAAASLALGSIRPMPWAVEGGVRVREVAHLALSFDHRLVDGELGSQVLRAVGEILEDPATALIYG